MHLRHPNAIRLQRNERTSVQQGSNTVQKSSTTLSVTTALAGISHRCLCTLSVCDFPESIRGSGSERSRAVGAGVRLDAARRCIRCALMFPAALERLRHSDISGCQSSSRAGSHSSQTVVSRPVGASCVPILRSSHHTPAYCIVAVCLSYHISAPRTGDSEALNSRLSRQQTYPTLR